MFDGKVVLITGAGSGIGRETAIAFAEQGARVVVADVNEDGGRETVRIIGDNATFIRADVAHAGDVEALITETLATYGKLDIAFNNAGVFLDEGAVLEMTETSWDATMNINVKGVWLCMKYELPSMIEQGRGVIINNSSVLGLRGAERAPAYCASKHAVIGLTKSAAIAYAQNGIRVNAVCPGIIDTPMEHDLMQTDEYAEILKLYPMRRAGTPREAADMILWLASDAASYITGIALPIDGGHMAF
ncbi:MAG: glucose 1-dehydrogenase [Chloroflexi bacterium]|nr:glucose 1-dehydrogenase [Chloroflexota bacterium]